MSCGGRIYKGDTVYVSVPFDVEGYSALTISFFTNGEYKITRTEEEVTIEDGFITAVFEGHDLDVLPDGVLRYTIECEVEGEEYVDSSNTMFYLKTPKDYDAETAEEIYENGYESGYTDGVAVSYSSGYTDGYAEGEVVGKAEGYVSGYTQGEAEGIIEGEATQKAKLQSATFESNGNYTREDGWSSVTVDIKSNLAVADARLNSIQQTFYKDNLVQGPNGETAYGGNLDDFKAYIDEKGIVQIKSWYNPEQTSSILQAIIRPNSAGTYEWIAYQAEPFIITPLEDIPSTWTQMDTYGGLFARYDGTNLYIYWNYQYGAFFTDSMDIVLPDEDLFFSRGYDGISALTVDASSVYQSGHTALDISGFEVGLGFYGPARVSFRNFDSDYPMYMYLIDMINPETGHIINIDSDFDGITWSFSGDGYHMIWMTPKSDIPSGVEWAAISGYRGDHVNIVLTDPEYEIGNFMRTEVNVSYLYYDSRTDDAHHLVKYLMEF